MTFVIPREIAAASFVEHLSHEDELALLARWQEQGDRRALDALMRAHYRLTINLVRKMAKGVEIADVLSAAFVGMIQAADCFDASKGARFNTHALWWMRAAISNELFQRSSLIRLPSGGKAKQLWTRWYVYRRERDTSRDAAVRREINERWARQLGLSLASFESLVQAMEMALTVGSLDAPQASRSYDRDEVNLHDTIADPHALDFIERSDDHEIMTDRRRLLHMAMDACVRTERERDIFVSRFLQEDGPTLEVLGQKYRVSRERVRQISERVLARVTEFMHRHARRELYAQN